MSWSREAKSGQRVGDEWATSEVEGREGGGRQRGGSPRDVQSDLGHFQASSPRRGTDRSCREQRVSIIGGLVFRLAELAPRQVSQPKGKQGKSKASPRPKPVEVPPPPRSYVCQEDTYVPYTSGQGVISRTYAVVIITYLTLHRPRRRSSSTSHLPPLPHHHRPSLHHSAHSALNPFYLIPPPPHLVRPPSRQRSSTMSPDQETPEDAQVKHNADPSASPSSYLGLQQPAASPGPMAKCTSPAFITCALCHSLHFGLLPIT